MGAITLVRQLATEISETDREVVRRVLFGIIDGLGEQGKRQWRRFFAMVMRLAPGELVSIETHKARSGPFHRRHMVMEMRFFEAQERFEEFEQFRNWLKVGAGHCDWFPGPRGGVVPVPRSISYARLEETAMRELHDRMVRFLRSNHAIKTLWPRLPVLRRFEAVEGLLFQFGEL